MQYNRYTVLLEPDEEEPHRYNVRVPALPGCLTYGESIEDALANATEAITGYVAVLVGAGEAVPVEDHPVIATSITVPVAATSALPDQMAALAGATRS